LQRLRDEAHRFGITYHRNLRKKRVISSELDEIEGIGPKRRKDLLKRFKSVKGVKEAALEELLEVVPERIARQLKKVLN
jgi:excinuclease ABC subunit C